MIEHLNGQNSTVKFDFICLEYVRMPGDYYRKFVTGEATIAGTPLLNFLRGLRNADKLNSGCKLLLVSICADAGSEAYWRWLQTKQSLEKEFGEVRDVEAKENPYYRACAAADCCSDPYDYIQELKNRNSNKNPFVEVTVAPVRKDNPLSEVDDEESDSALNTMLRDVS